MSKKLGLGQGVGLLFAEEREKYFDCDIEKIQPNKHQPRTYFNESDLKELSQSIKEKGVIQPLIVTNGGDDKYELIAGERRLRASKMAGLKKVPVVVWDVVDENSLLELALIENVQRTDLNPIEEAEAYRKLIDTFGYTQDETARRVGKQRTTITNLLRLLKLPDSIQKEVSTGALSEGHARSLIRLIDDPIKLLEAKDQIISQGLSVRQTERLVKKLLSVPSRSVPTKTDELLSQSYCNSLSTQLTNHLNAKVGIQHSSGRGKIEIEFYSPDDLDRLFSLLLNQK